MAQTKEILNKTKQNVEESKKKANFFLTRISKTILQRNRKGIRFRDEKFEGQDEYRELIRNFPEIIQKNTFDQIYDICLNLIMKGTLPKALGYLKKMRF